MKKKKIFLSLLLVLSLVLVLLPGLQTETEAAAANGITVYGYILDSGYYLPTATWRQTTTKPSGSYFYYNNGTLTLYNTTVTPNSGTSGIYADGDLVVNLSGTNKIAPSNGYAIKTTGTLKFTGSGSLTVNGGGSYDAIYSGGNMEFAQTGSVTATATGLNASGVSCAAKLTIGGDLTASADTGYAILASGGLTMNKGTVNVTGNCTYSYGGIRSNGNITVSGGTLTANSEYEGIVTEYGFFQDGGIVTVTSNGNGIVVERNTTNNVVVTAGTMNVTSGKNGITAQRFYMRGGTGYIKSTNTSSDSSYCAVKLYANSEYCFVMSGNIIASGSTTTSSGGLSTITYSNLPNYDYIFFTSYVTVNGVELRDGHYLQSGATAANTSKPARGGYAYYAGNTLTLSNYVGSNTSASGIYSRYDLNIVLEQGSVNKLTTSSTKGTTYRGINVSGALKISGLGQLEVNGGQYAIYSTDGLTFNTTQVTVNGGGIYSGSTMTSTNGIISVSQLASYAASGSHAIQADSDINIDGSLGVIYIYNSSKVGDKYVRGIVGKNITIEDDVSITSSGMGISSSGNVTISGNCQINAIQGTGIYASGTVKITGGDVDIRAFNDGVNANKFILAGGQITVVSTNTSNDASNMSIKVPDNTTTYFQIPGGSAFLASTTTSSGTNMGNLNDLETYDWVYIGNFVMLHGVQLNSGYYLPTGNSANTPTTTKPSGGYAYYKDGTLTLSNYSYSGTAVPIRAYGDLTLVLSGTSMLDAKKSGTTGTDGIQASGNLTIKQSSGLSDTLKITATGKAIQCSGNLTVNGGTTVITNPNGSGIVLDKGNLTMTGGELNVTALNDAILLSEGRLNMSDGFLVASCTSTATNDRFDSALDLPGTSSDYYNVSSALAQGATEGGTKTGLTKLDPASMVNYDYVQIGKFMEIGGVTVRNGQSVNGSGTLKQGNGGSGYAYYVSEYSGNTLTLNGYNFDGVSSNKGGLIAFSDLTVKLTGTSSITTGSLCAIHVWGKLTVTGTGSLTATSSTDAMIVAGGFTFSGGTMNVNSQNGKTTIISENFIVTGGSFTATSEADDAIYVRYGNLTVTGGEVMVESALDGVDVQKLIMTGGKFKAISNNTEDDDGSLALRASSVDLSGIGSYVKRASEDPSDSNVEIYRDSNRTSYDYVCFEPVVIKVNGIEITDGDYLIPGGTKAIEVLPSGSSAYAQRVDNKLNLVNYTYTGDLVGIESNGDLKLVVVGTNSFNTNGSLGIKVGLGMTVSGSGKLTLTGKDTNILCHGDLSISAATLKLTSNSYTGIALSGGDFIMNSGDLDIYAQYDGINADHVTFNGGTALIRSSNMTNDSSYAAIWANGITAGSGMKVLGATDPNGFMALDIDTSKLTSYDYIMVQERTTPAPDNVIVKTIGKAVTYTVSGNVVTVTHDKPCKVGYLGGDGKYVTLKGTKNSDSSYSFTAPAGVTEVLLGIKGDTSGDGRINVGDVSKLYAHVKQTSTLSGDILFLADISSDGRVNVGDVSKLYAHVKQTAPLTWDI